MTNGSPLAIGVDGAALQVQRALEDLQVRPPQQRAPRLCVTRTRSSVPHLWAAVDRLPVHQQACAPAVGAVYCHVHLHRRNSDQQP